MNLSSVLGNATFLQLIDPILESLVCFYNRCSSFDFLNINFCYRYFVSSSNQWSVLRWNWIPMFVTVLSVPVNHEYRDWTSPRHSKSRHEHNVKHVMHSTYNFRHNFLRSILIISSHPFLGVRSGLSCSGVRTKLFELSSLPCLQQVPFNLLHLMAVVTVLVRSANVLPLFDLCYCAQLADMPLVCKNRWTIAAISTYLTVFYTQTRATSFGLRKPSTGTDHENIYEENTYNL